MYAVVNTFTNNTVISRHRTLLNACKADAAFQSKVRKNNGSGSYIPTRIMQFDANGELASLRFSEEEDALNYDYSR
jgi:hypothetical protein